MKHLALILLVCLSFSSCKKEEEPAPSKINSMAEDLKLVIKQENIEALQQCCDNCSCNQSMDFGKDYSFPGDNFVRIQSYTYNLNTMLYYKIETVGNSLKTEKRLVLYFPK